MLFKGWPVVVAMLISLATTGMVSAVGQSSGVDRRTAPAPSAAARLSPQARLLYNYVKTLKPGELKWQRTPWLIDLSEAMRQAKAENRPILLWATDDAPLERC